MTNERWRDLVGAAVVEFATPFYLFAWEPVLDAIEQLAVLQEDLPVSHWYSFKTCPVRNMILNWKSLGAGIEVVSEYELLACLREGFSPEQILVNGAGKHAWLHRHGIPRLNVNFDSLGEVAELSRLGRENEWVTGIRLHVPSERDPDEPAFPTQFGLAESEFCDAVNCSRSVGVEPQIVSFHIGSNVPDSSFHEQSIRAVALLCSQIGLAPAILDIGGGLPVASVRLHGQTQPGSFDLVTLKHVLAGAQELLPSVREFWCENGRFVTARSAVLVAQVLEVKEREGTRFLVCDGGRTNNAIVSDWESHDFFVLPDRRGELVASTVCGPTCMAFDRLIRAQLPRDVVVGDYFVWMDAGAYHIPWETRFSHGLAQVLWVEENGRITVARQRESFDRWWGVWS
jgi:diaminopimelate decarboxylase